MKGNNNESLNPLVIGSMVLTAHASPDLVQGKKGLNPLVIGSMVLTQMNTDYNDLPEESQSPRNRVNGSHEGRGLQAHGNALSQSPRNRVNGSHGILI